MNLFEDYLDSVSKWVKPAEAEIGNLEFWEEFRRAVIESGPGINAYNHVIRDIVTKERCEDTSRFDAMSNEEVAWMGRRMRRRKTVRVYRAAARGDMAGFRFHTDRSHALDDLQGGNGLLLEGEVELTAIIQRIQWEGSKLVIVFPEKVKALKVFEVVRKPPEMDTSSMTEDEIIEAAGALRDPKMLVDQSTPPVGGPDFLPQSL